MNVSLRIAGWFSLIFTYQSSKVRLQRALFPKGGNDNEHSLFIGKNKKGVQKG